MEIYDSIAGEWVEVPDNSKQTERSGDVIIDNVTFFMSGAHGRWGYVRPNGTGKKSSFKSLKNAMDRAFKNNK